MTSPPDAVAVNGSPTLLKVEDQQNAILPDVRDYPKDSSRHSSASPEQELTNQPHPKIEKPSRPQEMSSGIICSVTGSSHTSLLEFGIHICPRCDHHVYGNNENDSAREGGLLKVINAKSSTTSKDGHRNVDSESEVVIQIKQIREDVNWFTSKLKEGLSESELDDEAYETDEGALSDEDHSEGGISKANAPPTAMEGAGDQQQGETVSKSLRDGKQSQVENAANAKSPQEETGLHHEIEFRDEGGYLLHRKRWRGPFNLDEARKGIKAHERKTIAKISTILVTNIPKDDDRSEKERIRISKEGFLRNSRVEFKHMKQQMVVRSKAFIEVLRDMVKYYPSINLQADALILTSPFCILAHHMAELQSLTALQTETELTTGESHMEASQLHEQDDNKERHSATAVDHIEKVLYFMRTNLISDQLDAEQARHARDPPMCTFGMMWLLYKPGTTVYVKDAYGKAKAYVVERFEVDETVSAILERSQPYIVILWNLSSDGTYVRRSREELTIGSFDGERPILDLKVIPASFVDASDGGKTREQLVQRGRKWYKMLTGAQQWHYSGQTVSWDKKTVRPMLFYRKPIVDRELDKLTCGRGHWILFEG